MIKYNLPTKITRITKSIIGKKYIKGRVQYVSSYHVALELTPEQVKAVKHLAVNNSQSVKDFITALVVKSIDGVKESKGPKKLK